MTFECNKGWKMKFKFATWNCRMGFQKKAHHLSGFKPDLAVVAECAKPDNGNFGWIGLNEKKGLGIFSYEPQYTIKRHLSYRDEYYYFLPVEISGSIRLNVLGVWAFNKGKIPGNKNLKGDLLRTPKAIHYYLNGFLSDKNIPSIVAGDFNNHVIWDRPGKKTNFVDIYQKFSDANFKSAYHTANSYELGKEKHSTHINKGKSYHIDYVFTSPHFKVLNVEIGEMGGSDHSPILVEMKL